MKLISTILFFIVSVSLFTNCSKQRCAGKDIDKGIIIDSVDIRCSPTVGKEIVITSDNAYQKAFSTTCSLPSIDFSETSLLGLYATARCQSKFTREVTKNNTEQNYHYEIIVRECGWCKSLSYSYNWVTVPKLQNGWTVTFEKSKE